VKTGAPGGGVTVRSTVVAAAPAAFSAVTSMAWRAAALGVPEITPVTASIRSPAGRAAAR
jgi:hypothetical protein